MKRLSETGIEVEVEINDEVPDGSLETEEQIMAPPFDPSKINVIPKQDTLSNLIERLKNDEIDMNTEFQRHADLWDSVKMSRFIESILIRFPIPSFYFDARDDNNWLIVDGLQRLSTIRKFVVEKNLILKDLEFLKDLNSTNYDDLPRIYKRRINECPITLFILQPGTPEDVTYSIFRRINTGGLSLNNQEIRFAMAPKAIREFMIKLAGNEFFIKTVGDQSKRMMDQELVLRFLAFHELNYDLHGAKNIMTFLDAMIKKLKESDETELIRLETTFSSAMERCFKIFGEEAFEKRNEEGEIKRRRKNSTLFEIWSASLSKLDETKFSALLSLKDELNKKHNDLMTSDQDYFRSITYSTQKREHFRIRHTKVQTLIEEVLNA